MQRNDQFENTLMLGKIEGGRGRDWQRMSWLDAITDSMDTSVSEPRKLVIEWPGVLQSMNTLSDWTELNLGSLGTIGVEGVMGVGHDQMHRR